MVNDDACDLLEGIKKERTILYIVPLFFEFVYNQLVF